jgi:hypothetical protein
VLPPTARDRRSVMHRRHALAAPSVSLSVGTMRDFCDIPACVEKRTGGGASSSAPSEYRNNLQSFEKGTPIRQQTNGALVSKFPTASIVPSYIPPRWRCNAKRCPLLFRELRGAAHRHAPGAAASRIYYPPRAMTFVCTSTQAQRALTRARLFLIAQFYISQSYSLIIFSSITNKQTQTS